VQSILHLGESALKPVLKAWLIGVTFELPLLTSRIYGRLYFFLIVLFPLLPSHHHRSSTSSYLLEGRRLALISLELWNGNEFLWRKHGVEHFELFLIVWQLKVEVNLLMSPYKIFVEFFE